MLISLYIENYALIKKMDIRFQSGLTVITGETGAGKSIVLGALGLILGQRADTSVLQDPERKCIVEATFSLKHKSFQSFFDNYDLDFDELTLIRREISAQGKSRAFINDTPVNLNVIKELGDSLVDIHSQHETLYLRNPYFQLEILDQYAGNQDILNEYSRHFVSWKTASDLLRQLRENERKEKLDRDYKQFLLNELEAAALSPLEQQTLEEEMSVLSHAGDIKNNILRMVDILDQSDDSLISGIAEVQNLLKDISSYHPRLKELNDRAEQLYIETKDINRELESLADHVQVDPQRLEWVQSRLDTLYSLQQKHGVSTVTQLLEIKDHLADKLLEITVMEDEIRNLEQQQKDAFTKLNELGEFLEKSRKSAITGVRGDIIHILMKLGMPNATLEVEMKKLQAPGINGWDQVNFLFSANKGSSPAEISKVASGGELSRLMLAVKSMVSRQKLLPTLIFDEIDMGISGEIAGRVGQILLKLSEEKQLIVITHLPQIAGKGNLHYYIYKQDNQKDTSTHVKVLTDKERVEEIARMISGDSFSGKTLETARELLENNH